MESLRRVPGVITLSQFRSILEQYQQAVENESADKIVCLSGDPLIAEVCYNSIYFLMVRQNSLRFNDVQESNDVFDEIINSENTFALVSTLSKFFSDDLNVSVMSLLGEDGGCDKMLIYDLLHCSEYRYIAPFSVHCGATRHSADAPSKE